MQNIAVAETVWRRLAEPKLRAESHRLIAQVIGEGVSKQEAFAKLATAIGGAQ